MINIKGFLLYINMDNPTRTFVIDKLSKILDLTPDDDLCTDLEKCIVRHSERRSKLRGFEAAWDNHRFTDIYKHKFLSLKTSLVNNPKLKKWEFVGHSKELFEKQWKKRVVNMLSGE